MQALTEQETAYPLNHQGPNHQGPKHRGPNHEGPYHHGLSRPHATPTTGQGSSAAPKRAPSAGQRAEDGTPTRPTPPGCCRHCCRRRPRRRRVRRLPKPGPWLARLLTRLAPMRHPAPVGRLAGRLVTRCWCFRSRDW
eukprot:357068-Chlamydomonas_euryale.AAC.2